MAMDALLSSGEAKSGQTALIIGFGAGLVYAGQDFLADMGGHSFQVEGALVSQGALGILNASRVDSIYNGDYLKSLLSSSANGGTIARMEVVFWNVR